MKVIRPARTLLLRLSRPEPAPGTSPTPTSPMVILSPQLDISPKLLNSYTLSSYELQWAYAACLQLRENKTPAKPTVSPERRLPP